MCSKVFGLKYIYLENKAFFVQIKTIIYYKNKGYEMKGSFLAKATFNERASFSINSYYSLREILIRLETTCSGPKKPLFHVRIGLQ